MTTPNANAPGSDVTLDDSPMSSAPANVDTRNKNGQPKQSDVFIGNPRTNGCSILPGTEYMFPEWILNIIRKTQQ